MQPKYTYGTVRVSKDVIFDIHNNFKHDTDAHFPTDETFAPIPSLCYADNTNDPVVSLRPWQELESGRRRTKVKRLWNDAKW